MIAAAAPRRFIPISTHLAAGGEGQYPQLREQAVMYCGVLHLVILSMVVLTSRWQNPASSSTHSSGGGELDGGGGFGRMFLGPF